MWYVCIYNGILLNHKKEQDNAICKDTDGPRDHTAWSQTQKTNIIMLPLICGILKKTSVTGLAKKFIEVFPLHHMEKLEWTFWPTQYKWTYLWNRNRLTDVENKLMVPKGGSGGEE